MLLAHWRKEEVAVVEEGLMKESSRGAVEEEGLSKESSRRAVLAVVEAGQNPMLLMVSFQLVEEWVVSSLSVGEAWVCGLMAVRVRSQQVNWRVGEYSSGQQRWEEQARRQAVGAAGLLQVVSGPIRAVMERLVLKTFSNWSRGPSRRC